MGYLWRVRLSSFAAGAATASAAGFFLLYKDHLLARATITRQPAELRLGSGPYYQGPYRMAELFTKQAAEYAAAHPAYLKDLFTKLAALTSHHSSPPCLGSAHGSSAVQVAEHYDSVLATDVSVEQLLHAAPHPKVRYLHTPDGTPGEDDLVAALDGEGCVDLTTVAEAVH
nr:unnamed protein product [Digitaria exilis]